MKYVTLLVLTLALSGCGTISQKMTTEKDIQYKAANSLKANPSEVKIYDVSSKIDRVTFNAKYKGKSYSCYYTSVIAVNSDAICKPIDKSDIKKEPKKESKKCNALLSAAGKC